MRCVPFGGDARRYTYGDGHRVVVDDREKHSFAAGLAADFTSAITVARVESAPSLATRGFTRDLHARTDVEAVSTAGLVGDGGRLVPVRVFLRRRLWGWWAGAAKPLFDDD